MKKIAIIVTVLISGLIVLCATASYAMPTPIWGTADGVQYIGDRTSENNGVDATGKWADKDFFKISWIIERSSPTEWTYKYTLNGGTKGINDFILEVKQDNFDFNIIPPGLVEEPINTWDTSADISLYGIKFDFNNTKNVTFTLVTDKSPVWGVFFAKSQHQDDYALSHALSESDYKINETLTKLDFIARPGGGTPVPEPPTMLLVGAGLIGLAGLGRNNIFKRRKK